MCVITVPLHEKKLANALEIIKTSVSLKKSLILSGIFFHNLKKRCCATLCSGFITFTLYDVGAPVV